MTEVEWSRVTKRFGDTLALDELSMRVGPGVHALLGSNGAGKSTALAMLTGARRPTSGWVRIDGVDVRRGSSTAQRVGSAPQELSFPATVHVREVVEYVAAHYAAPLPVEPLLERVGVAHLARRPCGALSGGQARRVGIACALVGDAPVVVLDEPSAGLDRDGQRATAELTRSLADDGRVVLLASHDLAEVERVADHVWLVARGAVVLDGAPATIVAGLGRVRVSFAPGGWDWRSTLGAIDPGLVADAGAERVAVTTSASDAVARAVLAAVPQPSLAVVAPTLGEAIDAAFGSAVDERA